MHSARMPNGANPSRKPTAKVKETMPTSLKKVLPAIVRERNACLYTSKPDTATW